MPSSYPLDLRALLEDLLAVECFAARLLLSLWEPVRSVGSAVAGGGKPKNAPCFARATHRDAPRVTDRAEARLLDALAARAAFRAFVSEIVPVFSTERIRRRSMSFNVSIAVNQ